jgi:predicted glycosyltransferase
MKFEINENKLEKVIFKYLDGQNFIVLRPKGNYINFIETEDSEYSTIKIIKEAGNEVVCKVDKKLIDEISSFFSIGTGHSLTYIVDWVENKLNIEITLPYGISSPSDHMNYNRY